MGGGVGFGEDINPSFVIPNATFERPPLPHTTIEVLKE